MYVYDTMAEDSLQGDVKHTVEVVNFDRSSCRGDNNDIFEPDKSCRKVQVLQSIVDSIPSSRMCSCLLVLGLACAIVRFGRPTHPSEKTLITTDAVPNLSFGWIQLVPNVFSEWGGMASTAYWFPVVSVDTSADAFPQCTRDLIDTSIHDIVSVVMNAPIEATIRHVLRPLITSVLQKAVDAPVEEVVDTLMESIRQIATVR